MPESAAKAGQTSRTAIHLIRFALDVNPRGFVLSIVLALVGSLTEGAGLVLLLPLLAVAGMNFAANTAAGRFGMEFRHLLIRAGVPSHLWLPVVLAVFLTVTAIRSMLRRTQSVISYAHTAAVQLALSRRVYEAIVRAQWGYLVRQRAVSFTHALTEELRQVSDALSLTQSLINLSCLTLLYLAVALKLSPWMTFLVLAMGSGLMLRQRSSIARMRASGEDLSKSIGEVFDATGEHLLNLKSVKTYDAEDRDVAMFARLCEDVTRHAARIARYQSTAAFGFEVGSLVALAAVVFLALAVLHVQAATMLLLLAIFTRLMPQLATLQNQAHQYASILPHFDHLLAVEADCLANAEPESLPSGTPATPLTLSRELLLNDIFFTYARTGCPTSRTSDVGSSSETRSETYQPSPVFVLQDLTLPIRANQITAIIGPSGTGKSTIADLTNGLLLPTRGQLVLDGQPLGPHELRQWRRQVGYVGQDTVLFHQSVRANLLWAAPDATEDDLRHALTLAAASFVYDLPGGLDSIVGDRGILLSSGQRQRIALARALLRRPTLLILDEATNALDVDNEARILEAIQGLRGTLTILMIAHRASAIRHADLIFELEAGRILRSGTFAELNP
jgi:ATP-binding cassette, subfamily C, bacterial